MISKLTLIACSNRLGGDAGKSGAFLAELSSGRFVVWAKLFLPNGGEHGLWSRYFALDLRRAHPDHHSAGVVLAALGTSGRVNDQRLQAVNRSPRFEVMAKDVCKP